MGMGISMQEACNVVMMANCLCYLIQGVQAVDDRSPLLSFVTLAHQIGLWQGGDRGV